MLKIPKEEVEAFGCTTIAYGQVMYALRHCEGFFDLQYSSGEEILWDRMTPNSITTDQFNRKVESSKEVHRFLGWLAENLNPRYTKFGTIIYNTNAKDFFRSILGDYVDSRYDNCIPPEDWNGYGWSENKKVAEEFFGNPNCYIIMTADESKWAFYYHTFVIDGMIEFQKKVNGDDAPLIKHLYHINPGWGKDSNGYFLYVENYNDKDLEYFGPKGYMDYRSKASYFVIMPF